MNTINQSFMPVFVPTNKASVQSSKEVKKSDVDMTSMSAFSAALQLETSAVMDMRTNLKNASSLLTPETRKEIIACAREMAIVSKEDNVVKLIDSKIGAVEKEAKESRGVDRFAELLFSLFMLLGLNNTKRNVAAAAMSSLSVKLIEAAGVKLVNASVMNLSGAVAGAALGTVVAAGGYKAHAKATSKQVKDISTNGREAAKLRHQAATADSALNRPMAPLTGNSPQEGLKKLDANGKSLTLQPNQPALNKEEHTVLSQTRLRTEAMIANKDLASKMNQQQFQLEQAGAHAVMGFAQPISLIASNSAGVAASQQAAAAKLDEADGTVASSVQQSEHQAAQRAAEFLMKIITLIATTTNQNLETLNTISRNLRA
ncbi:hypothetical protein [Glaciimonas immobilis]|uniref:Uncharacterized protein n=1 Tax=Glaciimonas immobilis TaxID=728004 RepID=A0A840RM37_9BURK|nr:hypothetical protein [Glaciimonas immobilis]KAF3999341.1 hypothetical protein HAV38_05265 [Glaciimonas immobilis]MBB5198823.1 hypothetical protein [Glaciimonas immobilis]